MAIGFRAQTQIASGGATNPTSAPALPTGTQNGDMVVYGVIVKYGSGTGGVTITPPTDWLAPSNNEDANSGLTNSGNDAGNIRAALFFREKDASWSTLPGIDLSGTPNSTMVGAISYSKGAGESWASPVCATAVDDTTGSTGIDPPASGTTIDFGSGDWMGALAAVNGDAGTPTVPMTVTVSGVTFGAATTRWNASTSSGTDLRGHSIDRTYTSGTASAGPDGVFTLTTGAAAGAGVMVFFRLRLGAAGVTGSGLGAYTFTGSAAGIPETFGTAAATLTFGSATSGVPRTFGTAAVAIGFTGPAVGAPRFFGTAQSPLTFAATATGIPDVHGIAAGGFTFTATANGFAGTPPVTGQATGTYTFSSSAAGIDRALGAAAASLTFSSSAVGITDVHGTAVAPFTVTTTAIGQRKTFAQAAATLAFSAVGSGFVGELPIPAGVPLYVTGATYTLTAGSSRLTAGGRPHDLTVPAGDHVVEA